MKIDWEIVVLILLFVIVALIGASNASSTIASLKQQCTYTKPDPNYLINITQCSNNVVAGFLTFNLTSTSARLTAPFTITDMNKGNLSAYASKLNLLCASSKCSKTFTITRASPNIPFMINFSALGLDEWNWGLEWGNSSSIVNITSIATAVYNPYQRKTFYGSNGYFYVFYMGTQIQWASSSDGITWSAPTTIAASTGSAGRKFSVWSDGTNVYLVQTDEAGNLYYNYGTLNSTGGINWAYYNSGNDITAKFTYPFGVFGNYTTIALYPSYTQQSGNVWILQSDFYGGSGSFTNTAMIVGSSTAGTIFNVTPYTIISASIPSQPTGMMYDGWNTSLWGVKSMGGKFTMHIGVKANVSSSWYMGKFSFRMWVNGVNVTPWIDTEIKNITGTVPITFSAIFYLNETQTPWNQTVYYELLHTVTTACTSSCTGVGAWIDNGNSAYTYLSPAVWSATTTPMVIKDTNNNVWLVFVKTDMHATSGSIYAVNHVAYECLTPDCLWENMPSNPEYVLDSANYQEDNSLSDEYTGQPHLLVPLSNGNIYAIYPYGDPRGPYSDISGRFYNGTTKTWGTQENIICSSSSICGDKMNGLGQYLGMDISAVADTNDNIHVVFRNGSAIAGSYIVYQNRTLGGTWSMQANITPAGIATDAAPLLALDTNNTLYMFFGNKTTKNIWYETIYGGKASLPVLAETGVNATLYASRDISVAYQNFSSSTGNSYINFVWVNSTTSPYQIMHDFIQVATAPAGGGAISPVIDIGDPLYCSVPPFIPSVQSIPIFCMPKDNTTGQPITGAGITCAAYSSPIFAASVQAASSMTEGNYGQYNWTLQSENIAANTCYIVNCTTTINTINNRFAGTVCVSQSFTTSCASTANVNAVGSNLTAFNQSTNNTLNNLAANVSQLTTMQQSANANITNMNTTLTTLLNQLGVNITSVNNTILSIGINITSVNNTIVVLGINMTAVNNSVLAVGSNVSTLANLTTAQVWSYGTRQLSSFGTLITDIWVNNINRTTNCTNCGAAGGTTNNYNVSNYSSYDNISYTAAGASVTAQGGDSMFPVGVLVVAAMSAIFAYLSINQKAQEWKLAFFLLSLFLMWVILTMSIEQTSISNQVIINSTFNTTTNTTLFTYGNVTDTTPQQQTLASLLNPVSWLIYVILAVTVIELLVDVIQYISKRWVK